MWEEEEKEEEESIKAVRSRSYSIEIAADDKIPMIGMILLMGFLFRCTQIDSR